PMTTSRSGCARSSWSSACSIDLRAADSQFGGACFLHAVEELPKCIGRRAAKVDPQLARLDDERVDDIPQIGAGPVSPVVGVEPFLEPGAKDPLCVEGAVVIDDHVVPPQILDLQLGVAERRGDRLEAENPLRLEVDNLGLAVVADEVRAGERAEKPRSRLELELDLGLAAD